MEHLIFLSWLVLLVAVPLALVVSVVIVFSSKVDPFRIIVGFPTGFFLHILVAYISLFPMFGMVYGGAHTQPRGEALGWSLRGMYLLLEGIYAMLAFSFCTYLAGRKTPWPIPGEESLP